MLVILCQCHESKLQLSVDKITIVVVFYNSINNLNTVRERKTDSLISLEP